MEKTAARHDAKRKRAARKTEGVTFSGAVLRVCALTLVFTVSAVFLTGLAVYMTPDPGAITFFAGIAVLVLSALFLSVVSVRVCPSGIYLCSAASAVLIAGLLAALCAIFGSFAGYAVTIYAGFILASLLFCALISMVKNRIRSRPRRKR